MVAIIVELIDVQVWQLQQVLNVYHFIDEGGTGDPATLAADYISEVIPLAVAWQSAGLSHTEVRYRQVFPTAELVQSVTAGLPQVGGHSTSDDAPTFLTASVKWNIGPTTNLEAGALFQHIKRGGVRLAGLREDVYSATGIDSSVVASIAAQVGELENPHGGAFGLCVASMLHAPLVLHGPRAHSPTATQWAPVAGASVPSPSTENSRKVLRGRAF